METQTNEKQADPQTQNTENNILLRIKTGYDQHHQPASMRVSVFVYVCALK
jgi:hypothetical protein